MLIQMETFWSLNALWNCNKSLPSLGVHPISLISTQIIFEMLVQHLIDPFYLAIGL
jgi:hypothetical protein